MPLKEKVETSNNFIDACSPTELAKITTQLSLYSSRRDKFTIIKHGRTAIDSNLKRYQQLFHGVTSFTIKSLESNKDMKILTILKPYCANNKVVNSYNN